MAKKTA